MILNLSGKGIDITDEVRGYVEKRCAHLEHVIGRQKVEPLLSAELELRSGEVEAPYAVRATLDIARNLLHAEAHAVTLHEAIDAAVHSLAHEAEKSKGKRLGLRRHAARLKDFLRGNRG